MIWGKSILHWEVAGTKSKMTTVYWVLEQRHMPGASVKGDHTGLHMVLVDPLSSLSSSLDTLPWTLHMSRSCLPPCSPNTPGVLQPWHCLMVLLSAWNVLPFIVACPTLSSLQDLTQFSPFTKVYVDYLKLYHTLSPTSSPTHTQ